MQEQETYTVEAAIAFLIITMAYKLYHTHCHLKLDDEEEEKTHQSEN
jgi:hypothetical protein